MIYKKTHKDVSVTSVSTSRIKSTKTATPFATLPAFYDDVNGVIENQVVVVESEQGGAAIFKGSLDLRIEDGVLSGTLNALDVAERSARYATNAAIIVAGNLELDLSLGTVFYFTHDEDCTISFIGIPANNNGLTVVLERTKDVSSDPRAILWGASDPDFENIPEDLTQTTAAVDLITFSTRDGGITFFLSVQFDNIEA